MLDIVPNHMAITGRENPWWWDVLRERTLQRVRGVLRCRLGAAGAPHPQYRADAGARRSIRRPARGRKTEGGARGRRPSKCAIGDSTCSRSRRGRCGRFSAPAAVRTCGSDALAFLADGFDALPSPASTDLTSITRRHRDQKLLAEMLAKLLHEDASAANAIDQVIEQLNSDPDAAARISRAAKLSRRVLADGRAGSWLPALLRYQFAGRSEDRERTGIRSDPQAGDAVGCAKAGCTGLRVDHPDGLRDPLEYFQRLRAACPDTWIVAEKILLGAERLRESWPIEAPPVTTF